VKIGLLVLTALVVAGLLLAIVVLGVGAYLIAALMSEGDPPIVMRRR
jgi:hypothetical protein